MRARDRSAGRFPWYDSRWLEQYLEARAIVAAVAPRRLARFEEAFRVLRTPRDFRPVRLAHPFDPAALGRIREAVAALTPAELSLHEARTFRRYVVHDHPAFDALQEEAAARVGDAVGEPVEASYNFLSLYAPGGVCPLHLDSPEAKWTLDLCLEQAVAWPIHFSDVQPWESIEALAHRPDWEARVRASLAFRAVELAPGEAVIFGGSAQWHYRDAMPPSSGGAGATLLFLHFIPRGTRDLLRPETWAARFGLPELAAVAGGGHS